jgi:phosphoglycerate dehydrogenase-like enzyme
MSLITQAVGQHSDTKLERVVFALADDSKKRFSPLFDPKSFPLMEYHWADISSMDGGAWENYLCEIQPTVLVTGWRSKAIPEKLSRCPDLSLRYICHLVGSVREFVPRRFIERGVLVTNWGTSISHTIAEHAILLTLGALRNLPMWKPFLKQWKANPGNSPRKALDTQSLYGKRVGLHGFGAVARELVRMLQPFGVKIAAYSAGVPAELFEKHGVRRCKDLRELFSTSDVLIECEALNPTSRGSVDEAVLRCLPENGVFVNVGRGDVVDEEALIRVASERHLRVCLDVYHKEPLSPDSALLDIPQAVLSPHIAGPAEDSLPVLWDFAMENLRRYLNGETLDALVTLDVYDRST